MNDDLDVNNIIESLQSENEKLRETISKLKLRSINISWYQIKNILDSPYYHIGFIVGFILAYIMFIGD